VAGCHLSPLGGDPAIGARRTRPSQVNSAEHAPHHAMREPPRDHPLYERCSDLLRNLVDSLAAAPDPVTSRRLPVVRGVVCGSFGWPAGFHFAMSSGALWRFTDLASHDVSGVRVPPATRARAHRAMLSCGRATIRWLHVSGGASPSTQRRAARSEATHEVSRTARLHVAAGASALGDRVEQRARCECVAGDHEAKLGPLHRQLVA
jgi:hypothetical protein